MIILLTSFGVLIDESNQNSKGVIPKVVKNVS
jgi:hypothetical protein